MQDVLRSFAIWFFQFLAVSAGLLIAARSWTLYRTKQRQALDAKKSGLSKQRNIPNEETPAWHGDPVLARILRVVSVLAVFAIGGSFLMVSHASGWFPWTIWSATVVLAWGLGTLWLLWAGRQRMELGELRQFANRLELAALQCSDSENAPPEFLSKLPPLSERDCKRLPAALQQSCFLCTSPANMAPDRLRSFADAVHLEISRQALNQARSLSRWGKYPLLMGIVPLLCFLLIVPLTEWMQDRISTVSPAANSSPAREKSPRGTSSNSNKVPVFHAGRTH